jgi:hypothetical protein
MRIPVPFGRKGLIVGAAIAAGSVFWRMRAKQRAEEDRRFEEEITRAVEEGAAAGGQQAS